MNLHAIPDSLVASEFRLATLEAYGILGTPPDAAFDGIVRLATRLCRTPVGLVSFVAADRQWFKARIGFPACETDLDRSVCKFALAEPDLLVIPDLAADPRTSGNPLVTGEPGIRFYAGAPLRTPEGQVLGSQCVIDMKPRPEGLTSEQADDLRVLAEQVVDQLRLRRSIQVRDRIVEDQRKALRQTHRLDVLARASTALLLASDPAEVLEPILVDGADVLGFDRAYIYDVAEDGRHLRLTHAVNVPAEVRERLDGMAYGAPLCGIVAETCRPLVLGDIKGGSDPAHAPVRALGLDAYAGFPVLSQGALRAVISFASTRSPAFDLEAVAFFETLARLMAVVYERLDATRDLHGSDARFRALASAGTQSLYRMSPDWLEMRRLDGAGQLDDAQAPNRGWATDDIQAEDHVAVQAAVADAIENEVVFESEHRVRRADGSIGWTLSRAIPIRDQGRNVVEWFGAATDVTDRVQAERRRQAQLTLGDRLRDLASIPEMTRAAAEVVGMTLDVTRAGYGRTDGPVEHVDIEFDWTAPGVASIAGRHRFAEYGDIRADLLRGRPLVIHDVRTDPRTRDDPAPLLGLGIEALVNMPVQDRGRMVAVFIVQDDKPHPWSPETLMFLRNVGERLEAGIARVRAEEQQRVLNEEIAHRLKNTLAMVLSIATQTLRTVPDRAPVEAFEQRIHALSNAHNVLMDERWTAAPMSGVVRAVLQAAGHGDRIVTEGPDLTLGPQATLSLSLLMHEMATNAAKYGSLSVPEGRVSVAWRLEGEGDDREIVLDWVERGGPPAVEPARQGRKGFGSRLIRMGLVGTGGVDLRFTPLGLEATMRGRLVELQRVPEL